MRGADKSSCFNPPWEETTSVGCHHEEKIGLMPAPKIRHCKEEFGPASAWPRVGSGVVLFQATAEPQKGYRSSLGVTRKWVCFVTSNWTLGFMTIRAGKNWLNTKMKNTTTNWKIFLWKSCCREVIVWDLSLTFGWELGGACTLGQRLHHSLLFLVALYWGWCWQRGLWSTECGVMSRAGVGRGCCILWLSLGLAPVTHGKGGSVVGWATACQGPNGSCGGQVWVAVAFWLLHRAMCLGLWLLEATSYRSRLVRVLSSSERADALLRMQSSPEAGEQVRGPRKCASSWPQGPRMHMAALRLYWKLLRNSKCLPLQYYSEYV